MRGWPEVSTGRPWRLNPAGLKTKPMGAHDGPNVAGYKQTLAGGHIKRHASPFIRTEGFVLRRTSTDEELHQGKASSPRVRRPGAHISDLPIRQNSGFKPRILLTPSAALVRRRRLACHTAPSELLLKCRVKRQRVFASA